MADPEPPAPKKAKVEVVAVPEKKRVKAEVVAPVVRAPQERRRSETVVEVDGKQEAHIILSPTHNPPEDPPEPEELVKALLVSTPYPAVSSLRQSPLISYCLSCLKFVNIVFFMQVHFTVIQFRN